MGILIIIIALIVEVAFMVACIKTRENQNKARSWVRIAAFVTFVVTIITSIIEWGLRWYLLATLLAIFALIGAVRLFTKKFGKKPTKAWHIVSKGIRTIQASKSTSNSSNRIVSQD